MGNLSLFQDQYPDDRYYVDMKYSRVSRNIETPIRCESLILFFLIQYLTESFADWTSFNNRLYDSRSKLRPSIHSLHLPPLLHRHGPQNPKHPPHNPHRRLYHARHCNTTWMAFYRSLLASYRSLSYMGRRLGSYVP